MKTFILFGLLASTLLVAGFAAAEEERPPAGITQPAERPRVSHGPFRRQLLDSYNYSPYYSHFGYGNYPGMTFGGYAYFPEPGRTNLWLAAGSNNYLGAGLATSMIDPETGLIVGLLTSWESGETWWGSHDYESFLIAPTVAWSHGNTTFWVGFEHAENTLEVGHPNPRPRPVLVENLARPDLSSELTDQGRKNTLSWYTDTLHTGVHHCVSDSVALSLSFSHSRNHD